MGERRRRESEEEEAEEILSCFLSVSNRNTLLVLIRGITSRRLQSSTSETCAPESVSLCEVASFSFFAIFFFSFSRLASVSVSIPQIKVWKRSTINRKSLSRCSRRPLPIFCFSFTLLLFSIPASTRSRLTEEQFKVLRRMISRDLHSKNALLLDFKRWLLLQAIFQKYV